MSAIDKTRAANEYVRKIREYLEADKVRQLKAAVGTACSMQTIRNLANGKIEAVNSTVFKNGKLGEICSKLPELRVEEHYTAYKGFFKESSALKDTRQEEIKFFEGSYDVFHNGEDAGFEIKRLIIRCKKEPFFPNYFLHLKHRNKIDKNDGFIFNTDPKLALFGISEKYIVNMTMEKSPIKIFKYTWTDTDSKKQSERTVKLHRGTIDIFNLSTGDSYISASLFLERDTSANITKDQVYGLLPELSSYY